jgi:hypothetical protein
MPDAHRQVLRAAFGLVDAAAPDIFRIALAPLDLIAEIAAPAPLLLIAEDAHWLDRSTLDVLAFVARRLHIDPTMRALADQLASQRATTAAWIVDGIMQRSTLRTKIDRDQAIDTIWLLMDPVVFCRLTRDRAWTPERFERWITDSIPRLLLPPPSQLHSDHDPPSQTTHRPRTTRHERGTER